MRQLTRVILPWLLAGIGLGAGAILALFAAGFGAEAMIPVGSIAVGALTVVGIIRAFSTWARQAEVIHSDLLAGLLPCIELKRAERAYCETLVLLAKPDLQVDEQTARAILTELNRLMEQIRRLEAQRVELQAGSGPASIAESEQERDGLAARLAGATDPHARAHLEESLRLCESRLENVRALQPSVERLEAQQEVIIQTVASIQSTLARMESAHQALTAPDVEEIQQRLRAITGEARAVESALEEVTSLRRG